MSGRTVTIPHWQWRLIVWASVLGALGAIARTCSGAPPTVEIPRVISPAGDYAQFVPAGDAVNVVYVGLSNVDPFPSSFLRDPRSFVLPTRGLPPGEYRFAAVAASKSGEQTRIDFAVRVGGTAPVPPDGPKPPDPPAEAGTVWLVVLRPDGPASAQFAQLMRDGAWATLRASGVTVKDYGASEACRTLGLCLPDGTVLPVVVTLRVSPDGRSSRVVRPAVACPTTTAEIVKLGKDVPK